MKKIIIILTIICFVFGCSNSNSIHKEQKDVKKQRHNKNNNEIEQRVKQVNEQIENKQAMLLCNESYYDLTIKSLEKKLEQESGDYEYCKLKVLQNPGNGFLYCNRLFSPLVLYALDMKEQAELKELVKGIYVLEISNDKKLASTVDNTILDVFIKENGIHRYTTITGAVSTVKKYSSAPKEKAQQLEEIRAQIEKLNNEKYEKETKLIDEIEQLRSDTYKQLRKEGAYDQLEKLK